MEKRIMKQRSTVAEEEVEVEEAIIDSWMRVRREMMTKMNTMMKIT
jgi:regulator of sigma D